MTIEPKIWVLGSKNPNADKSISWDSELPHLGDPDVLIINLNSLDKETLTRIDKEKYNQMRQAIMDKFVSGGTIIIITAPHLQGDAPNYFDNYYVSPIHVETEEIPEGYNIKQFDKKLNPFSSYVEEIGKFNFYLKVYDFHFLAWKLNLDIEELQVSSSEIYKSTDNSNHVLSIALKENKRNSGLVIFLPPTRKISISEGINKLLESFGKTTPNEVIPEWASKISLSGIKEKESELAKLQSQKQEVEGKIKSVNEEKQKLLNHRRLLYSNGSSLEGTVYDAFRLVGFKEIKQIREKDKEDGVIEFQTRTDFKYGIIEVEGSDKRTSIEKLDQCNRWVNDHFLLRNEVKGIFISNQFRSKEYPQSKSERVQYEHNQLKYATTRKLCIIPSCVLFEAVNKALENKGKSRAEIEKLIAETNGILTEI